MVLTIRCVIALICSASKPYDPMLVTGAAAAAC
jgi:hypothetical protein